MRVSLDVPETWGQLKDEMDITWRSVMRIGINQLETKEKQKVLK